MCVEGGTPPFLPVWILPTERSSYGRATKVLGPVDPHMQPLWVNRRTAEKTQKNVVQMWCTSPFDEPLGTGLPPSQPPDQEFLWSG